MELSLRFEDNDTAHKDIFLTFAGRVWVCDSYYLHLDSHMLPKEGGPDKVRAVLHRLLGQWLSGVENLQEGATVYLPYDFSDQYTAWLRCVRVGKIVEVCRGWAEEEGYSIFPSEIGHYLTDLQDFRAVGPLIHVPYEELLDAIRNMLM